ncbi:MAG TPA: hypothetical protein VK421_06025 [Pyrinomonadaceae bacterium]|nr:hypothetical protein [Pyrinomonadaceae bacterium]
MKYLLAAAFTTVLSIHSFAQGQPRGRVPSRPQPQVAEQPAPSHKVTVALKGGETVTGTFSRADAKTLHLEVAGSPLALPLENIEAISFGDRPAVLAPTTAAQPTSGTLLIEAGIIYKMGGNQPVARTEFHLLDEDAEKLMSAAGLRADGGIGVLSTYAIRSRYPTSRDAQIEAAEFAVRTHTKFSVTTDFQGRAQFADVPPGRYWVYGMSGTRRGFAIWNVPVEIRGGQNSLSLDQNNAAAAF